MLVSLAFSALSDNSFAMVDENDIWRAALAMVERHGVTAPRSAARRAEASMDAGDVEGFVMWGRVLDAVIEIQRPKPAEGEMVN